MEPHFSSNGHTQPTDEPVRSVNAYADAAMGEQPAEIVQYEMDTDPYANMLPGYASVRAASTVGRGVKMGRTGRPWIMAVSVLLILVLILPAVVAIISHFGR